jgi:capsule polysaccharide export protein KpsE/RkpR
LPRLLDPADIHGNHHFPASATAAERGKLSAVIAGFFGRLTGGAAAVRTPADQYVALMQSATVSDRIVDQFKLMEVYDSKYRIDARRELARNVRANVGKKDGLITVEVDDNSPQRAADMANRLVDELRRMTDTIAISDAQQRRKFFEQQFAPDAGQAGAGSASIASQRIHSGRVEGRAQIRCRRVCAAESRGYGRRSPTADTARLLSDATPEVQQQQNALAALRGQLARLEQTADGQGGPDYVGKYREFKYQETLFDLFAKQYELARVDESREGALIQVVDPATAPEKKSKPKRVIVALTATLLAVLALTGFVLIRRSWRAGAEDPINADRRARLRQALGRHQP